MNALRVKERYHSDIRPCSVHEEWYHQTCLPADGPAITRLFVISLNVALFDLPIPALLVRVLFLPVPCGGAL